MSEGGTQDARRRSFERLIVRRLDALRLAPNDVLVLRLPQSVIEDEGEFDKARMAAVDIAQVAKRGVVLIEENAPLSVENLAGFGLPPQPPPPPSPIPFPAAQSDIIVPGVRISRPRRR